MYSYNSIGKHAHADKLAQKSSVIQENSNCILGKKDDTKIRNSTYSANKICTNPTKGKMFAQSSPTKHVQSISIADKAAIFETASPTKISRDPALLSVSERKALFEKNKGEVLIPKAAFGMAPPVKVESIMKAPRTKIITDESVPNKSKTVNIYKLETVNDNGISTSNKETQKAVVNRKPVIHEVIAKSTQIVKEKNSPSVAIVQQSGGIASRVAALMQNKSTISEAQIANSTKSQRQKEMDLLLNRFNKNKEVRYEYFNTKLSLLANLLDLEQWSPTSSMCGATLLILA